METKIHFTVKALCAAFIFYQLWIFIFSRQMYDAWEKVCRMMRIARIKLWKCRKEYRIYREEKADVIGKTKIVYLEDPEVARKTPTRSEPLVKEPIEEDEEIRPEDVAHEDRGLAKEEMEALMAPVNSEPDPEFNTAMTFEEMNNVVEVLTSETGDEQKDFRASMTIYHKLSGTEILNLLENEIGCQQKIESLLNEYLDETGRPLAKRKAASKKMEAFNIDKFV